MCTVTHLITCWPSTKNSTNCQSCLTKVLPKRWESQSAPTITRGLWSKAHTRDGLEAPSRPQQLLLLKLSSTISFSLHQQHTAAFSHLTGKGAELPTFLLKWHQLCPFSCGSTYIPQLHSIAAHSATSNPVLADSPGQASDHSCST